MCDCKDCSDVSIDKIITAAVFIAAESNLKLSLLIVYRTELFYSMKIYNMILDFIFKYHNCLSSKVLS